MKTGRPKKVWEQVDIDRFKTLCKLQCTEVEICDVMEVSDKTLVRLIQEHLGDESFSEAYKKYSAEGKSSLRRLQYQSAQSGNVTMQIWLGKQWLGQADKMEQHVTSEVVKIVDDITS